METVSVLDTLGVDRHRTTVHHWVQKAELHSAGGTSRDHVALDETVIQLDDQRYWLYAAVYLATNRLLHVELTPTRTMALTSMFLTEFHETHRVDDTVLLVDSAPWLQAALARHSLRFQYERHGNRNRVERVSREVKRGKSSFSNTFNHAQPETVESGLQAFAVCHNVLY